MSVTIADILKLPAMKGATVLTKHSSLAQVVTSATVLEVVQLNGVQTQLKDQIHFKGNEIVLTSFSAIANDVSAQCANVELQIEYGEVAMVLYYVGVVMPRVEQRLIETADRVGMVLICMPQNDLTLAYSDLISETFSAVQEDAQRQSQLTMEVLDQVTKLPKPEQHLGNVLAILSKRLHIRMAVFDAQWQLRYQAGEPVAWEKLTDLSALSTHTSRVMRVNQGQDNLFYDRLMVWEIPHYLLVTCGKMVLNTAQHAQIMQIMQMVLRLWQAPSDPASSAVLVADLMKGDAAHAFQVAHKLNIDIGKYTGMWLVQGALPKETSWPALKEVVKLADAMALCERYADSVVVLIGRQLTYGDVQALAEQLLAVVPSSTVSYFTQIGSRSRFAALYQLAGDTLPTARVIFPHQRLFTEQELLFAQHAHQCREAGDADIERQLECLQPYPEWLHTLAVYFLDAHGDINATAEQTYVHRNTIKYRLRKVADLLGTAPDRQPMAAMLTLSMAVHRLLDN
ncbi:PucR family transcriptional regulator [Lacticaseibacillus sp. GG6-2]